MIGQPISMEQFNEQLMRIRGRNPVLVVEGASDAKLYHRIAKNNNLIVENVAIIRGRSNKEKVMNLITYVNKLENKTPRINDKESKIKTIGIVDSDFFNIFNDIEERYKSILLNGNADQKKNKDFIELYQQYTRKLDINHNENGDNLFFTDFHDMECLILFNQDRTSCSPTSITFLKEKLLEDVQQEQLYITFLEGLLKLASKFGIFKLSLQLREEHYLQKLIENIGNFVFLIIKIKIITSIKARPKICFSNQIKIQKNDIIKFLEHFLDDDLKNIIDNHIKLMENEDPIYSDECQLIKGHDIFKIMQRIYTSSEMRDVLALNGIRLKEISDYDMKSGRLNISFETTEINVINQIITNIEGLIQNLINNGMELDVKSQKRRRELNSVHDIDNIDDFAKKLELLESFLFAANEFAREIKFNDEFESYRSGNTSFHQKAKVLSDYKYDFDRILLKLNEIVSDTDFSLPMDNIIKAEELLNNIKVNLSQILDLNLLNNNKIVSDTDFSQLPDNIIIAKELLNNIEVNLSKILDLNLLNNNDINSNIGNMIQNAEKNIISLSGEDIEQRLPILTEIFETTKNFSSDIELKINNLKEIFNSIKEGEEILTTFLMELGNETKRLSRIITPKLTMISKKPYYLSDYYEDEFRSLYTREEFHQTKLYESIQEYQHDFKLFFK